MLTRYLGSLEVRGLLHYVAKRLGYMIVTLWTILTLTFVMMHLMPGDPFTNPKLTPAVRANLMARYGFDKPLYEQYYIYVKKILKGDMGISMQTRGRPVNALIKAHFPVSAKLGVWALGYAIAGGLTLGVVAALRRNKTADYVTMGVAVFGISVPGFVLGTVLQFLLSVQWQKWFGAKLLPVAGWGTWQQMMMPVFVLGLGTLAGMARMMRSSMLDVLGQDYVKTAKAKGLSGSEIVWRHTIRNSLLPIITILGPTVINIVTGSLIVETVFGIPGLGKYFADSVTNNDYTVILGTTVFYSAMLIASLFVVDLAYGLVDPRIRLVRGKA